VAGRQIIDRWGAGPGVADGYIALPTGAHPVRVEYRQVGGRAAVALALRRIERYDGWRGAYYANADLAGAPAFVRDDARPAFDWDERGPGSGLRGGQFSASWSRPASLRPGRYRFSVTADDGVRLWVAGTLALDAWERRGEPLTYTVDARVATERPVIRLDYRDRGGGTELRASYRRLGDDGAE
jgi:hypothetical protein